MKHTCEKCGYTAAAEQFGDGCPACEGEVPVAFTTAKIGDAEFSKGDEVTFKPYDKGVKMFVRKVTVGHWGTYRFDDRIFYHLSQWRGGTVTSVVSGKCIEESKLFEQDEEV